MLFLLCLFLAGPHAQSHSFNIPPTPSARASFRTFFPQTARLFDAPPRLQSAFADAKDSEIQAFFRATHQGTPVRGWISVTARGQAIVAYDEPALFAKSFPGLIQRFSGGAAPAAQVQLQRQVFPDGSGSIGVPPGWHIGSSWKGIVDLAGPKGSLAVFGYYQQVMVNWIGPPSPIPGTLTGRYRDPARALRDYYDAYTKGAVTRGQASFRVVEAQPLPGFMPNANAALMLVEVNSSQGSARSLALVSTSPINSDTWMFYMTQMAAPLDEFPRQLPTMMQMWASWSLNPALLRERLNNALQSMRETYSIIQGVNANAQRAGDRANLAWSQTIRGVTTIEDRDSGRRGDVDTNIASGVVRDLNDQGYNYRIVPVQDLIP